VALAQPHLAAADLAEARAINDRLRQCLADFDPVRFTRLNEAFHRTLSDPCPNAQLKNLVDGGLAAARGPAPVDLRLRCRAAPTPPSPSTTPSSRS
jgi:DNA-binding GntR family transcriptional regulator